MIPFEIPEPEYDRYSNRQLLAVPLVVLAIALLIIGATWVMTGAPAVLGIDFTGGTEIVVETSDDPATIEAVFDGEIARFQTIQGEPNQYILTFDEIDEERYRGLAEERLEPVQAGQDVVIGSQGISATFAADQRIVALYAILAAFLGMSLLAFVLFRTFIPSIAIVVSAFSDIMIPLAAMNVLNIPLELGTVAALLLLIGYSVDSDILLNTHVLRRGGEFYESVYRAMQTGVTMTITSMAAMLAMFTVASLFGIEILAQIGLILFIGLAADLMNTYLLNFSLLRWYKFRGPR